MLETLTRACALGLIRPLDLHFAVCLAELAGEGSPELLLAAALASRHTGEGQVCLPLPELADTRVLAAPEAGLEGVRAPAAGPWRRALQASGLVGEPGAEAPLILDRAGRLYLGRYWHFEAALGDALLERARPEPAAPEPAALRPVLDRLFPAREPGIDWQKVAAAVAARRRLTVVSGGPGTGKTRTVTAMLALLLELADGRAPRTALAAPTGKAAARLSESVRQAADAIDCSASVRDALPREALTIHRLLGARAGGGSFRHGPGNPLHLDLLVVDEASMVDLPLMSRLLQALPAQARLILLGDRDQLASVEPGYVLGDLCGSERLPAFSAGFRAELEAACGLGLGGAGTGGGAPLGDSVVPLIRSYRFGADSGIGALAAAINRADAAGALAVLDDPALPEVSRAEPRPDELPRLLDEQVVPAYGACLQEEDPARALAAFARVRVLAAVREGPYGVVRLNRLIEDGLRRRGRIRGPDPWYPGRPVMVTRNDYGLNLFNGDLGVALPGEDGRPRVWFPAPDGRVRGLLPARLPAHETVYAMTVHKSQGSEFDQVLAVLPEAGLELATRELVYTAVTRARQRVTIWASRERLAEALARRVRRSSALRERLWGGGPGPPPGAPRED